MKTHCWTVALTNVRGADFKLICSMTYVTNYNFVKRKIFCAALRRDDYSSIRPGSIIKT